MEKIVAYLSHSYRPEDRAINMAIWRLLNAAGIVFAVDPPSREKLPMDVTFLERMMQRSQCFVAIVPHRSHRTEEVPRSNSTWSPYQEFEYRLAVRANKPRLIFLEKASDEGPLSKREPFLSFDRVSLDLDSDFEHELQKFVEYAKTRQKDEGILPKIGVLLWLPADPPWQRVSEGLADASPNNIKIVDIDEHTPDHELLDKARDVNVLITDIHPKITPGFLLGLLHGAAIPVFRTCFLESGEDEAQKGLELGLGHPLSRSQKRNASELKLPSLFRGYRVDDRMRPVHFWNEASIEKSVQTIAQITISYRDRERRLETQSNGSKYFLSLTGNRVFISTAEESNVLTQPLKHALDFAGMPAFHYREPGDIPVGAEWMPKLSEFIANADLLVAFLSPAYWDSAVCISELREAIKRWERHQLLLMVCIPDKLPPMPQFLGRYQGKRLTGGDEEMAEIVTAVRQRFTDVEREDWSSVESQFAQLVERHLDVDSEKELTSVLEKVCGIAANESAAVAARVVRSSNPPVELADILVRGVRIERFGAGPLGRLCFYLRRLESDAVNRDWLTRQFSRLRLFPNLHDIDAWNRRRTRKQVEVCLASEIPRTAFELVTALTGEGKSALNAVIKMGSEMAKYVRNQHPDSNVTGASRIAVVSQIDDLMIPVEWAVLSNSDAPLARARPVFRQISDSDGESPRDCIEDAFEKGVASPPRALLFGHATADLPNVQSELREIQSLFDQQYSKREWPRELVECVRAEEATWNGMHDRLSNSDYDILHIAGHAGWIAEGPAIQVADAQGSPQWILANELGRWLRGSSVKFVYLSCCGGAAVPIKQEQFAGWRQNLCREVLRGGVPEVVAYVWPVSDEKSVPFTRRFYETFLTDFDAPRSMHAARDSCDTDDLLWAASLIIKQATNHRS